MALGILSGILKHVGKIKLNGKKLGLYKNKEVFNW
jgi:hypothetical protein